MPFINVSPFHEFLSGMNFILQINVGVVKLTGASGTGKTALLQELVRSTTQAQQDIVAFYAPPASFQQIKDAIRQRLNLDPATNFHDAVLSHVLSKPFGQRRLIVVLDNAELMDEATLRAVGHLRSIQHSGQHLIGIVLCGSLELNHILSQPGHRQLAEGVLLSYELSPLSPQQLPDFCRACLATRGLESWVLAADDYRQIMQKSGGLPGKVAELVETYWPEDPELPLPSVYEPASAQKQKNTSVSQTTAVLENPTTVAEPLFPARSIRTNVNPDVTPVVSPDMSLDDAFDLASEYASIDQIPGNLASEAVAAGLSDAIPDSPPESRLDFASGFTPEALCDSFVDVVGASSQEALAAADTFNIAREIQEERSVDLATAAAPDVADAAVTQTDLLDHTVNVSADLAAEASADTLSGDSQQSSPGIMAEVSYSANSATAAEPLADVIYDVVPEPLTEVSFDFSTDTPVEIAFGLAEHDAAPPSAALPETAPIVTLASATSVARTQFRIIAGILLAASVVVVLAQILHPGADADSANEIGTEAVAVEAPAPATIPQTANERPVPAVNIQQFGTPPVASPVAGSVEVVPQVVGTAQAPAPNIASVPSPAISAVTATPIAVPAIPVSPQAIATASKAFVGAWTEAWQSLDVDAYLGFYHADFVPPNQLSRTEWESDRRRIISSQNSISIELADFQVLAASEKQMQVQFMLTYRGDTYADRTLKQLVLQPDASGELRIVQEQSLRTEVFDPVIEAAVSWMPDSATVAANRAAPETAATAEGYAGTEGSVRINEPPFQESSRPVAQATAPAQSPEIDEPVAEGARNGESAPSPTSTTIPLIFNLTALSSAEVADVNNVLQSWADAWRNKDTDAYFGHYHADYKAPEATSVAAWREQRIARISAPDAIDISLAELEILENNDNNLLIELLMEYHTDNYSDRTLKRMMLSKSAQGLWLITMENNIEVKRL